MNRNRWHGHSEIAKSVGSTFVDNEKFANYVYDDANRDDAYKLGNTQIGDGYKFRGRGIIQLSGRDNYAAFNSFYRQNYDSTVSLLDNPDLISGDMEIAVLSALWFFKEKVLDKIDIDENTSIKKITRKVNGGENGLSHRKELFDAAKSSVDCI